MKWVLDSSAILANYLVEPGGEVVADKIGETLVSTVNLSEVAAKLFERGISFEIYESLRLFSAHTIFDFDREHAVIAAQLRNQTRKFGLSLGDRACLALAIHQKARVLTADRAWADLKLGVEIEVIR